MKLKDVANKKIYKRKPKMLACGFSGCGPANPVISQDNHYVSYKKLETDKIDDIVNELLELMCQLKTQETLLKNILKKIQKAEYI